MPTQSSDASGNPNFRAALEAHRAETRSLLQEEELRMQSLQATARLFKDQLASLQDLLPETPQRQLDGVASPAARGSGYHDEVQHRIEDREPLRFASPLSNNNDGISVPSPAPQLTHERSAVAGATPGVEISPMSASPSVSPQYRRQAAGTAAADTRSSYTSGAAHAAPLGRQRYYAPSSSPPEVRRLVSEERPRSLPTAPQFSLGHESGIVDSAPVSARRAVKAPLRSPSPDASDPGPAEASSTRGTSPMLVDEPMIPVAPTARHSMDAHAPSSWAALTQPGSSATSVRQPARVIVSPAAAEDDDVVGVDEHITSSSPAFRMSSGGGPHRSPSHHASPSPSPRRRAADGLVSSARPSPGPASPRPETPQFYGRYARHMGSLEFTPGNPDDWEPGMSEYNETPAITNTPDPEDLGISVAISMDGSPVPRPLSAAASPGSGPASRQGTMVPVPQIAAVDDETFDIDDLSPAMPAEPSPSQPEHFSVSPVRTVRVAKAERTIFASAADLVGYVVGDTAGVETLDDGERSSIGVQAGADDSMPPQSDEPPHAVSARVARILGSMHASSAVGGGDWSGTTFFDPTPVDLDAHEKAVDAFCEEQIERATIYARQRQLGHSRNSTNHHNESAALVNASVVSPRRAAPLPPR